MCSKLLRKCVKKLRDGISKLDEQVFKANKSLQEDEPEQDENIRTQLLQYQNHPGIPKNKKKKFKKREFLHSPGTKEG